MGDMFISERHPLVCQPKTGINEMILEKHIKDKWTNEKLICVGGLDNPYILYLNYAEFLKKVKEDLSRD